MLTKTATLATRQNAGIERRNLLPVQRDGPAGLSRTLRYAKSAIQYPRWRTLPSASPNHALLCLFLGRKGPLPPRPTTPPPPPPLPPPPSPSISAPVHQPRAATDAIGIGAPHRRLQDVKPPTSARAQRRPAPVRREPRPGSKRRSGRTYAPAIRTPSFTLIGPLQSGETREAVELFDAIHRQSFENRPRHRRGAAAPGLAPQAVHRRINTGEEPQQAGIPPKRPPRIPPPCRDELGLQSRASCASRPSAKTRPSTSRSWPSLRANSDSPNSAWA